MSTPSTTKGPHPALLQKAIGKVTSQRVGGEGGRRIMQDAVAEISSMEGLQHVNFTKYQSRLRNVAAAAGGGGGGAAGGGEAVESVAAA
ncbi:hypothetical protein TSOC_009501 [Tetrabaena socialis]|uniref:Uncharacterized protein n=1 Tax=Tetrabaena socialis TaxID=47790 RepID=A0A2J7ZVQ4_9CHLO|nr:hypothetical protein TSOC_009501 [Tetrabaena socialis]|eukprot:PNH04352.1 hypothetical protein TSOC_009501 [Tetrabaena socialis]